MKTAQEWYDSTSNIEETYENALKFIIDIQQDALTEGKKEGIEQMRDACIEEENITTNIKSAVISNAFKSTMI